MSNETYDLKLNLRLYINVRHLLSRFYNFTKRNTFLLSVTFFLILLFFSFAELAAQWSGEESFKLPWQGYGSKCCYSRQHPVIPPVIFQLYTNMQIGIKKQVKSGPELKLEVTNQGPVTYAIVLHLIYINMHIMYGCCLEYLRSCL